MRFAKILGLATVLAIAPAIAQTPGQDATATQSPRTKLSFAEKMAKAEADLKLTAAQQPLWDAYVNERKSSYAAHKTQPALDLPSWLNQQQKQFADEAQVLQPLWASLTIDQRQIADNDLMPHRRGKRHDSGTTTAAPDAPETTAQ